MVIALLLAASLASAATPAHDTTLYATVNGVPVTRGDLDRFLWDRYGELAAQEYVDHLLVAQASAALGITVSSGEIVDRLNYLRSHSANEAAVVRRLNEISGTPEGVSVSLQEIIQREKLVAQAAHLAVTDQEVRAYFDSNRERLALPPAAHLRWLVVGTEKEAADFALALRAGADFASVARQASIDAETKDHGGELGFVAKGAMPSQIDAAVFSLKPSELAGPLKVDKGYAIFQVEELRPYTPAVLRKEEQGIRELLLAEKAERMLPAVLEALRKNANIVMGQPPR